MLVAQLRHLKMLPWGFLHLPAPELPALARQQRVLWRVVVVLRSPSGHCSGDVTEPGLDLGCAAPVELGLQSLAQTRAELHGGDQAMI